MIRSSVMLKAHRRHLKSCPHVRKGWNYTLCSCPLWCDGILNGIRVKRSLGTNDWDRALRRIRILEQGGEQMPDVRKPARTIATAVTEYLDSCRGRNLRESTIDSYSKTLGYLDGTAALDAVGPDFVEAHRKKREIASNTWRKELEHLRTFFAWCIEHEWIDRNPAKRLRMPRVEDLTTLPFTPEEVSKLLAACDQISSDDSAETPWIRKRARALLLLLLYSGLRISDVAQLRRSALELSGHLVLKVLKTGVRLKVLLHADAVAALQALPAISREYFFWTGNGDLITCIKNMRRTVQRLGAIAKVHAHPHRFRDTFAVELLTQGADIRTVQKLLGHTSVRTTEKHYAHFVAAHQSLLDTAASRLEFQPKAGRPLLVKSLHNRRGNPK